MHYFFESVLVGVYSCLIFYIISGLTSSFPVLLFVCGFVKHMCGYYIGIHNYYYHNGYACKEVRRGYEYRIELSRLILESILEGICFVFLGLSFSVVIRSKFCNIFSIGVFLHLLCEWIGLHRYFCRKV
jgi:hypothetical protein